MEIERTLTKVRTREVQLYIHLPVEPGVIQGPHNGDKQGRKSVAAAKQPMFTDTMLAYLEKPRESDENLGTLA